MTLSRNKDGDVANKNGKFTGGNSTAKLHHVATDRGVQAKWGSKNLVTLRAKHGALTSKNGILLVKNAVSNERGINK
jgi:hypothetical protein